jgi:hypothetical protein
MIIKVYGLIYNQYELLIHLILMLFIITRNL